MMVVAMDTILYPWQLSSLQILVTLARMQVVCNVSLHLLFSENNEQAATVMSV